VRGRRQKLHPHADPAASTLSEVHDPAFLFFLRLRMYQNQHLSAIYFVLQDQQSPVRAYHQRFADLPELSALMAAAQRLQSHLVKDSLAASLRGLCRFGHALIMFSPPMSVNCPFGQVYPTSQARPFPATCTPLLLAVE
jgi:hypothetical protein